MNEHFITAADCKKEDINLVFRQWHSFVLDVDGPELLEIVDWAQHNIDGIFTLTYNVLWFQYYDDYFKFCITWGDKRGSLDEENQTENSDTWRAKPA